MSIKNSLLILLLVCIAGVSKAQHTLEKGSGIWMFSGHPALQGDSMRVFYHRPEGNVQQMPILFVMHGIKRNADTYRDNWIKLADEKGILVIVPEFTQDRFPGSRAYNNGNVQSKSGEIQPDSLWSFSLMDPIFDGVVAAIQGQQQQYDLFGHSAGSQFVHRFFLFKPEAKTNRVVAANAGTYTMFNPDIAYPYGLKGTGLDDMQIKKILQRKLVVQLGEADTDPKHQFLNVGKRAMAQGAYRLERGLNFYKQAQEAAKRLGVECQWILRTVPEADHDNAKMAQDIVTYLYP